jgi:hypothetical protein
MSYGLLKVHGDKEDADIMGLIHLSNLLVNVLIDN